MQLLADARWPVCLIGVFMTKLEIHCYLLDLSYLSDIITNEMLNDMRNFSC